MVIPWSSSWNFRWSAGHEGQLINLIGRDSPRSSPEMATRNQSSLFLRADLRLENPGYNGQVMQGHKNGRQVPRCLDSEPAAAATRGASQDQSRYLPKERPESPRERRQVDTSRPQQRGQGAKCEPATCVTGRHIFNYHVLFRHSSFSMWFFFLLN